MSTVTALPPKPGQRALQACVAGVLCLSFYLSACVAPEAGKNSHAGSVFRGDIRTKEGKRADITVLLGGTSLQSVTDDTGYFEIPDVPPGRYRAVIREGRQSVVVPVLVPPDSVLDLTGLVLQGNTFSYEAMTTYPPGEAPPRALPGSLADLAEEAGVDSSRLQELAETLGMDLDAWDSFLETGRLPDDLLQSISKKDLLRIAQAAREQLKLDEATALLSAITGMELSELRSWFQEHAGELQLDAAGALSADTLSQALVALREGGDLDELLTAEQALKKEVAAEGPTGRVILYDAAEGTLPEDQGWWYLSNPLDAESKESMQKEEFVRLDSTPVRQEKAGYFSEDPISADLFRHPGLPKLDRQTGFTVGFQVKVVAEQHVRDDRAGFSVIVVCEDLRAIELGFWEADVWAQADDGKPIFQDSRAETASFDTSGSVVEYELLISGDDYELRSGETAILDGSLRDYRAFGGFPYDVPGFLFLGDNTTSAKADLELAQVWCGPAGPGNAAEQEPRIVDERIIAQQIAEAVGMNPVTALQWMEKNRERLPQTSAGTVSPDAIAAAVGMIERDAKGETPSTPRIGAAGAGMAPVGGGGGGGGGKAGGGEALPGGMAGAGTYAIEPVTEITPASSRFGAASTASEVDEGAP